MGVVYRAYDPTPLMQREVAVKTLHELSDPLALKLFYKECGALKSISHPNIVEIYDIGEFDDEGHKRPFFVMPLLSGQTLEDLIRNASHRLTVDRVVEIVSQTCRGLQAAHDHGLVHRDLKPSNIFVLADDSVKLIDFGVAHAVHGHSRASGFRKGTLLYMAPEQVQHKPVSAQSDIYSLGVTTYEALTRRQPFREVTEESVVQAILNRIPPAVSELNPSVSHLVSRVIHKALAKQPWNRYDSAREFGDTLQKALRNESLPMFDPEKMKPRLETATKALERGDYQFAAEIVTELEAEGNVDPQVTLLRTEIDQVARQKTLAQLLESARARFDEEEDPLALQKIQEVLHLDPTNVGALSLKAKIENRRNERQIEKWIELARRHVDNHSYEHAHEALRNVLSLRPKDTRANKLLRQIESEEQEYAQLREEKTSLYHSAVNAWKNGEISQALTQMRRVLELDRRAPDTSSSDAVGVYQSFYNQVRSAHEAISQGHARARRLLVEGDFAGALQTCREFQVKYPGHALFQALEIDIQEQQRQRLSTFIADLERRLDAEPDLEVKVGLLKEARTQYPEEAHIARLAKTIEDKRDLVNSILERAKLHESQNQFAEALSDFDTLQTIYSSYPGLEFERERLRKRLERHNREVDRASWVRKIDQQLTVGSYVQALNLLDKAQSEYPDDNEFIELRKLAEQGVDRVNRVEALAAEGEELCARGEFEEGIALLTEALQLEDRSATRVTLRDLLVAEAQRRLTSDWQAAEALAERALEVDPGYALAGGVRSQARELRRAQFIDTCAAQARRHQATGDLTAAITEVEQGLLEYPEDPGLLAIRDALHNDMTATRTRTSGAVDGATRQAPEPPPTAPRSEARVADDGPVPDYAPTVMISRRLQEPRIPSDAPAREHSTPPVEQPTERIARPAVASPVPTEAPRALTKSPQRFVSQLGYAAAVVLALGVGWLVWTWVPSATPELPDVVVDPPPPDIDVVVDPPPPSNEPLGSGQPDDRGTSQGRQLGAGLSGDASSTRGAGETGAGTVAGKASTGGGSNAGAGDVPPGRGGRASVAGTGRGRTTDEGDSRDGGRGAVEPVKPPPPPPPPPPEPPVDTQGARAAIDAAQKSESAADWVTAIQRYETARKLDPGLRETVAAALVRVRQRMAEDGTDAYQRARQYDALDRTADAVTWYERAVRNLPESDPTRKISLERLRVLRTR
jgi:serine/threonine-protein kinase